MVKRAFDKMAKRTFDLVLALGGLILLSAPMMVVAVAVRLTSAGPAFYLSQRVGQGSEDFTLLKFRTMSDGADSSGPSSTAGDDPRITSLGTVLRRHKIDELPQLINVLRGDMSFVGPRPQVRWAVDLYSDEELRLLDIRPGITDWASIKFSNEAEILRGYNDPDQAYRELIEPEKVRLGLAYVDTRSFSVDLTIIAHTIRSLFGAVEVVV